MVRRALLDLDDQLQGLDQAVAMTELVAARVTSLLPLQHIGCEFMPRLDEGDLLYMPSAMPGLSAGKAAKLPQQTDRLVKTTPQVLNVYGKAGRAGTATDPRFNRSSPGPRAVTTSAGRWTAQ